MMTSSTPYHVPQEPGRWAAIALAILVHAILLAFLWIGISWVSKKPDTIEAEVWSTQQLEQAPQAVQPPPPAPEVVKPPEDVKEAPVVVDPEIAIEQEKKKLKKEKEKRDAEVLAKKEEAEKKLAAEKKQEEDDKKKLSEDKRKQDALDLKKAKLQRDAEVRRITAESGKIDGTGSAARSQGNQSNAGWVARVQAKVKSNIVVTLPSSSDGNDPAEFVVGLLPDGTVAGIRKTKSSGIPVFDDAVRRAIEASQPYPADSSGRVPSSFISNNKPKDQ